MRKARTPLLKFLIRSFHIAMNDTLKHQKNETQFNPGRRKFIKDISKAAIVTSIASSLPISACTNTSGKRVVIIGAGIAGLHCAYLLKKQGIVATIYEADKRVGGRMKSRLNIFAENMSTEFGGEFIDTDHEDMHNLVNEFGLELIDTHKDTAQRDTFYFNNIKWSEQQIIEEFKKAIPTIKSDREACGVDFDTEVATRLDNMQLEEYFRTLGCDDWFIELLDRAYMAEFGLECREQSSLNFVSMIGLETDQGFQVFGESDERFKVVGGNQRIVDELALKLEGQIELNHYLGSISHKNNTYSLTFKNNQTIEADIVVMTIPFTILRTIEMDIPDMSAEKINCINELGYGQNNKIMLSMSGRPWRNSNPAAGGYLVHSSIHNGWDNGHMQNENEGPTGYTIFLGGGSSESIAKIVKQTDTNDRVPDGFAEVHAKSLDQVFPGVLDSYNKNNYAAMWSNNPYVHASYTCYKVGQWTSLAGLEIQPVGNLFFAGEHCSDKFQGYMNGAAETGRLVAEELIKRFK